jgi:hypothetical protein
MVSAADRDLQELWATTTTVAQADTRGRFSVAVPPGQYVVNAVPADSFDSWNAALEAPHVGSGGLAIAVKKRAVATVTLTLRSRSGDRR